MADPVTAFHVQPVRTRAGRIALVTIDNGADWQKPSTFGREALESLERALERLEGEDWSGLVLTGKPLVFAVGADITAFPGISPELARLGGRAGHDLFARLRALPYRTLAAVNGAALGGGVEIALHCDERTLASSARQVAFPEVFLGLIPGWGGTQLVPRLVGAERAVKVIVENPLRQNRMLTAPQALELGLVDHLLDPVEFLDDSIELLVRRVEEGAGKRELDADLSDAAEVCAKARARVDDQVHGAAPAPYRALELIEGTARWTVEEGYRAEEDALAELLPGPEGQASIYAFDVVERRTKRGVGVPEVEPRTIGRVGVVGAGLMATQLAALFLRRLEAPVVLTDVDPE
ncbi:MAG: enoyl-CoA hydratase-related protein, partial [Thermoleophilia bacterium]|nr:enoyl-CoA hydratase-related protein [Thermoleophilia bacterium]